MERASVSEPTDYEIASLMQQLGGTFVARLAACWMVADYDNRAKLIAAFPDYWDDFRQAVILRKQQQPRLYKVPYDPPESV